MTSTTTSTPAKIGTDGTVTRDGQKIGRIERTSEQTIGQAIMDRPGSVAWQAYGTDGAEIGGKQTTRKRALALVESAARPLVADQIKIGEHWTGGRHYVSGWVSWSGYSLHVSRYAGEPGWAIDALFTPGAMMPAWSHGDGDRSVSKRVLDPTSDQGRALARAAVDTLAEMTLPADLGPLADALRAEIG